MFELKFKKIVGFSHYLKFKWKLIYFLRRLFINLYLENDRGSLGFLNRSYLNTIKYYQTT